MAFRVIQESIEICDKCEAAVDREDENLIIINCHNDGEMRLFKNTSGNRHFEYFGRDDLIFCDKECATDYFRNLIDEL
jgi:hypothetical protein